MPDSGKIAQVTPILKGDGGDESDFDNYRGISILPIISKCIEHCVHLQTNDYFESNNLLSDNQFGFRKKLFNNFLGPRHV